MLAGSFVGIDFETADNKPDSACAVGLVRVCDGIVEDSFYSCIRPPRSKVYFTHIHGFTWNMLKDQPSFAEIWPRMEAFVQGASWLVAHNAPFDRGVLQACCSAAGVRAPAIPFACTLKGARRNLSMLPSRSLSAVCQHFSIELQHHHAGSDAMATAKIFLRLLELGLTPDVMASKTKGRR